MTQPCAAAARWHHIRECKGETRLRGDGDPKYWFPAKRYGRGWGLPSAWQGWVVLLVYVALVLGGIPLLQVSKGNLVYIAYVSGFTVVLVAVCWLKGEPPRWRWGDRDP